MHSMLSSSLPSPKKKTSEGSEAYINETVRIQEINIGVSDWFVLAGASWQ